MGHINRIGGLLLAAGLTSATSHAATIIYQDDFSGIASTQLNGQAPDTRPAPVVWAAGTNVTAAGTVSSSSATSAWLPYTFAADTTYSLAITTDIAYDSPSTTPIYIGFSENSPFNVGNILGAAQNTYGLLGVFRGGGYHVYSGPNNDVLEISAASNTLFNASQNDLEIRLELTTSSIANPVLAGYVGGVQIDLDSDAPGLTYTFPTARNFTGVGFGVASTTSLIESFTFSAVPEPAMAGILAGVFGMAARRTRRR